MYKLLRMLSLLFIGILVYGCTATPDELKKADLLIETAPDKAYHILLHLNRERLNSNSDKALYALLMSQALDKKIIKVESDSLIRIATDYYNGNDPVHAGYAWLYRARCANNRGNATEQADALLKAQKFAAKTDNDKLKGLIYGDKGILYSVSKKTRCFFLK